MSGTDHTGAFQEDILEKNYIIADHVSKTFFRGEENELEVLQEINVKVQKGEFICIVGGSGCGKSTLLRAIAGLDCEHEGEITVDREVVKKTSKKRGLVFQEHRLFPWLSVLDNVCFALDEGSRAEKEAKARQSIELVGLAGFEQAKPKELSGGMAQRANIARALVNNPPLLLLDEPFGALDAFTKIQLQNELIKIKNREGSTMIMVTHDIEEAVYLADRVIVMTNRPGTIREIVSVNLPRPRNRNEYHFVELRKRISSYFFETPDIQEDYNI